MRINHKFSILLFLIFTMLSAIPSIAVETHQPISDPKPDPFGTDLGPNAAFGPTVSLPKKGDYSRANVTGRNSCWADCNKDLNIEIYDCNDLQCVEIPETCVE